VAALSGVGKDAIEDFANERPSGTDDGRERLATIGIVGQRSGMDDEPAALPLAPISIFERWAHTILCRLHKLMSYAPVRGNLKATASSDSVSARQQTSGGPACER
jgi:hypothetical protein